jgi:aquaporin rerated protein, other eukaryote
MVGGMAAAAVVSATFPGPMHVNVRLGGGTSVAQGLFIEMFTTTQLVFTVVMLAVVKHKATYLAPIGIGIALFIGNMTSKLHSFILLLMRPWFLIVLPSPGAYFSGAGINPTRVFGPDVVNRSFPHYHWIYWLGPVLGALLAAAFYHLLEAFGWRTANPGQDYNDVEASLPDLSEKAQQSDSGES